MTQFTCDRCALAPKGSGEKFVLGAGNLKAELMIVGDAPSRADARTGIPLSSQEERKNGDHDLLMRLLTEAGIDPNNVFRTTLTKCRPNLDNYGNVTPVKDVEIAACHVHLDREISYVKPKVIIALGAATTKRLLDAKSVASVQGRVIDSAQALGFTWALSGEVKSMTRKKVKVDLPLNKAEAFKVLGTYSFAMVRRDPVFYEHIRRVFQMAAKLLKGEALFEAKPAVYHYGHTEAEVYKLLGDVYDLTKTEKRLFFDIETSGLNWYPSYSHDHVAKILTTAFGFKEREVFGVSLRDHARSPRVMKLYRDILESKIPKTGHNGKFDNVFIRGELGIRVQNYDFDTMLAAWQLDQGARVGMDVFAPVYRPELGFYWEPMKKYLDDRTGYLKAPDDELLAYNCKDVDVTATLYNVFQPQIEARGFVPCFTQITMPHQAEAEEMEFVGAPIDVEATKNLGRKKLRELDEVTAKIYETLGRHPHDLSPKQLAERGIKPEEYRPFNPGSGPQLAKILYEEMKLPVPKYTDDEKKTPSTDEDALEMLKGKAPFVDLILQHRTLKKQLSTYIGWERHEDGTEGITTKKDSGALLAVVDKNHRVHTSINVHGTATGRTSSSNPNLQNVPKTAEFRSLFKPKDGYRFGDADYGSLELRILAYLSGDQALIKAFREGLDLHSATGAGIFGLTMDDFEGVDYYPNPADHKVFEHFDKLGDEKDPKPGTLRHKYPAATKDQIFIRKNRKERKVGKNINFGVVYGKGAKSLAEDLTAEGTETTKDQAQSYLDGWSRTYAQASAWIQFMFKELERTGCVTYSMGRQRRLPGIHSASGSDRGEAKRQCINTPVQGTGADCTSLSVIAIGQRLRRELGSENARLILEIHDQVVVEFKPEFSEQVRRIVVEEMERPKPMLRQDLGLSLVADYDEVPDLGASVNA